VTRAMDVAGSVSRGDQAGPWIGKPSRFPNMELAWNYPARIFAAVGETEKGVGQRFESDDGRAVLLIDARETKDTTERDDQSITAGATSRVLPTVPHCFDLVYPQEESGMRSGGDTHQSLHLAAAGTMSRRSRADSRPLVETAGLGQGMFLAALGSVRINCVSPRIVTLMLRYALHGRRVRRSPGILQKLEISVTPHFEGLTRAVQKTTRPVRINGPTPAEGRHNMSVPIEPDDPDVRVHAAWLAQISEAADGLVAKQVPQQDGGSTSISAISSNPAIRLVGHDVPPPQLARLGRRSGRIVMVLIGFIFALALAAVSAIPQHLWLSGSWRQPTGDRTMEMTASEPLTSATRAIQNDPGTPKLIVQSSRGVSGEPAPIGLALRGAANDAVVLIRGLVPGMELSTGGAVSGDTWQLSAADLPYAWIAPPEGFVGSADLVAELRLSNDKIADRRAIHLEWMTPISPAPARPELDRESIPQLQPDRQDVQPQRIIDTPHVPQSTGAKGITVESRVEPEITNSTCFASASAVRQDHPEAWPSWTLRALGHEGTKCWYPTTRTLAHDHPK
jgi:hypothetical protein